MLVFLGVGLASHASAVNAGEVAATAWPFLAGAAVGWVATRAWRRPAAITPTGLGIWSVTVSVGMVLRALSGDGIAPVFVAVTSLFLGATMLGWRAAARRGRRARV